MSPTANAARPILDGFRFTANGLEIDYYFPEAEEMNTHTFPNVRPIDVDNALGGELEVRQCFGEDVYGYESRSLDTATGQVKSLMVWQTSEDLAADFTQANIGKYANAHGFPCRPIKGQWEWEKRAELQTATAQ